MWCHVLLFGLPVLGLPLFWIFPLPVALAIYVPLSALSVGLGLAVICALRKPVKTGAEGLPGRAGRVLTVDGGDITVQVDGELWRAQSVEALAPAQPVDVLAVEGLTLKVRPHLAASPGHRGVETDQCSL